MIRSVAQDRSVVVIGAGQAGLAVSRELTLLGIEHLVLERARVGQTWRDRWDSFSLVTPNWTLNLPGAPYAGDEPEGFVVRDEIVRYLEHYASTAAVPVREGVNVEGRPAPELPDPPPFRAEAPSVLELEDFGAVVLTAGFRPDYNGWVHFPAFDAAGFPLAADGASTVVPGLFFCGVHFLPTRKSSLLWGVGAGAAVVAQLVAREKRQPSIR